ncbi:hypothetical protein [Novosphingobium sp. PASSN1]|uniref:hypothetical protein n=1 Tax=Novosphingobium sp. PASSN1 TaxID=2015561 RepID=UPI000BCC9407|nr:hypothetical protein [Novosphingobium sp. PASSN1]OYU37302.1 MAG: hypothetical protein CFE35_02780 [Novosphingobium sp. PASSN1]
MAAQRSESVVLLTLVDFLIQIIFFGLLVFVFYKAAEGRSARNYTPEQVGKAIDAAGVSNIVELTDELTKLAPMQLKELNGKLHAGSKDADIAKLVELVDQAGGAGAAAKKLEQGLGRPPCLVSEVAGKRQVTVLASLIGSATTITFEAETPELRKVLTDVGLQYSDVRSLPLARFRNVFNRVVEKFPNCRYTVQLRETTGLVFARDAVQQIFYTKLRR